MQQNQYGLFGQSQSSHQQVNSRFSNPYAQRKGNIPGYHLIEDDDDDDDIDVSEIPGEHHDKEGQHEYKNPTDEERNRDADLHEHPFSGQNSPRGGMQTPDIGSDGPYTSRITY